LTRAENLLAGPYLEEKERPRRVPAHDRRDELARRGQHTQAEQLAREAVAIGERTDALNWQGDALCDLAQVLHAAGQSEEAAAALARALERYQQKNNLAMSAQVRERLAELQDAAPR